MLTSKPNAYVKMLSTNNTIESKHPNCITSQWWNTNGNTCLRICLSKNSKNFIQQQDSQVSNCSLCPPWTLTTVFQSWSPLISGFVDHCCWSRLAQKVRTLSLRSSKPTIGTLYTHLAAKHPREHNWWGLCPDCLAARQKARWSWVRFALYY